ncbi:hypothetical protein NX774_14790 [Massilia agilis]|uniref:Uncharacterized protein n=1 Tax=Massilia agilis TaxID=1811226 RepID=A0ABT2DEC7_9BURK|nr:hypothetical protein [Massilia agilis]MCS0809194.1 hypothetical protein [Massilia agilis]
MVLAILLLLLMIYMIYVSARSLVKNHQGDLNIVWYFFSLSVTATALLGMLAIQIGAIDKAGQSHGKAGDILAAILTFFIDLKSDVVLAAALISLVLVPQILTYLLSGLFGCAKNLFFVEGSVAFFVWFVVKSFAVASGVGIAFAIVGMVNGWPHAELAVGLALIAVCLFLLVFAFSFLSFYRNTVGWVRGVKEATPAIVIAFAQKVRRFMIRNKQPA